MKGLFRSIVIAVAALATAPAAMALDLPVKDINGKLYYYYAVQRGDNLLSVARRLGVTRDDITTYNPSAADGLRQGNTLYLPVERFRDVVSPGAPATEASTSGSTTTYTVGRGETLFGISHQFGLTPNQLIELNPEAVNGVKAGQKLRVPGTESQAVTVVTEVAEPVEQQIGAVSYSEPEEIAATEPEEILPIDTGERRLTPVSGNFTEETPEEVADTTHISLMLPLMLEDAKNAKQSRSATDFVRGFMLGLKPYSTTSTPLHVAVYDTENSSERVATLLSDTDVANSDVIVAPSDAASLSVIATGAPEALVLNLFLAQDSLYQEKTNVMQANAPHKIFYGKAAEGLASIYDGYTPVFLIHKGGKSDKIGFTDYLRNQFAAEGIAFDELTFENSISASQLEKYADGGKYVFIPASGALAEFNKIARPLINLRDDLPDPSVIGLFGYPDWLVFKNDAATNLHKLGATIYSRFFAELNSPEVKQFMADFAETYGTAPAEQVPSQAMLGYDTAQYLVDNISHHHGTLTPDAAGTFKGLQSSFKFSPAGTEGPVNQVVYFVTFLPGDDVKVDTL